MQPINRLAQAYRQAPWRKQTQEIGVYLASLVVLLLLASIYVNITGQTAVIGRQIQRNHKAISQLEREIAELESQLAMLESDAVMRQRAEELGFRPAFPSEITHVVASDYSGRSPVALGISTQPSIVSTVILSPAYSQSWVDWIQLQLRTPLAFLDDVQP
ncbi:MAG: hypothetical protein ABFS03_03300 [Chloroflexota bacterium]